MTDKASEGLIPVEAPPYPGHSPVSPVPSHSEVIQPAPVSEQGTGTYMSTTAELPAQQQPIHGDNIAPVAGPPTDTKAYPNQPHPEHIYPGHAPQYSVNAPPDVKAYPGQPMPEQIQQQPMYYTPYGHPSGYATASPLHSLQSAPCPVDCPACGYREMTRTEAVAGMTTHGWAALLCFCCCLGCIPYLMSSLKDVDHYCGRCGVKLARWHNSGRVEVLQHGRRQ